VAGWIEGDRVAVPGAGTVDRFRGIPYAAPPVGERRLRAPAPLRPWPGTRAATAFGLAAPQATGIPSRLPSFSVAPHAEDCLTVNVWTPADRARTPTSRPVLVWLHGGAYLGGGTAMGVFDGARLAVEGDVVVMTANYRLGALGYLRVDPIDDDADSNCAVRDQMALLAWAVEHAAAFGGDPRRVTVFGESAGAGSVLHLCVARRQAPFARAIVQSGEPRTLSVELADRVRHAFLAALDVPDGAGAIAAVRERSVGEVLAAQDVAVRATALATGLMPFHPTFDSELLDLDPIGGFTAGRARHVELVIGNCRDELRLWPDPRADGIDDARLVTMLGRLAPGADPERALAAYRADDPDRSSADVWQAARTDAVLRVPALRVADAQVAAGGRAHVYRFDWEAPGIGAAHAVDLPFTFGTFDRDGWGAAVGADARPGAAEALSRAIRNAWSAFAATGDPGHAGLPRWPAYDTADRPTMCLDAESHVVDDPGGAARAAWMA
jgi:para-nitrobenzyl esterase